MSQIPPVISLDGINGSCSRDESSSQMTLLSLSSINSSTASNLSGTIDSSINQTEFVPIWSNTTMDMIRSPISNDEQNKSLLNESTDKVNLSSLSFIQTKQRRINHRRNKSEPVITASLQDLSLISTRKTILESSSTSTTSNESAISTNASFQNKRKYSKNSPSIIVKQSQQKSSSSTTKKKKSWYNPFQSTYRQRHEEFRKVFKDLPNDERLIVDYSCAWQKEILIQGRMYISQNYLCFHANFLKWETSLSLKFQDINAITREKTAKVIPNAIEIKANKNEKYFFASFATRDKSYSVISKIWKTISSNQKISSQQLWTIIHENYGNDLDMTTDEDDNYHQQSIDSTPEKISPKQQNKNEINHIYDRETPTSIRSKSSEKEEIEDRSSISSHCERQTDDDNDNDDDDDDDGGIIPIGEEANTNTLIRQSHSTTNQEENSPRPMAIAPEMIYLSSCPCKSHLATQLIDRSYSMSVERLFDNIFGDNDFLAAYHSSRRIKDFHGNQWKINEETGKRERVCTYKVDVTAVFGATTICSNEKQMMDYELSNSHYIIDTEVRNEGIKYADTFFVASRYCLTQIGPNKSHLKVTCEVRYIKSLMIIIKSFIEKNAMAALQDSFTDLNNRIDLSISSVKRLENESFNRQRSSNINNDKDQTNQLISKKKSSRKQQSIELNSSINDSSSNTHRKQINQEEILQNNQKKFHLSSNSLSSSRWSTNNILIPFCLITMLILLSVNIFLCVKLNEIDRMTDRLMNNSPLWLNGYSYPKEDNQWTILLKRQEEYYQTKLTGLHSVLMSTHNALKNVTDALNELSKVSGRSPSNAPADHIHSL